MKLLVTGGRDYENRDMVFVVLDDLHVEYEFTDLAHGACPTGADLWADQWARAQGITVHPYAVTKEEWRRKGKSAGPIRNSRMVTEFGPAIAVSFPGGRGTADCTAKAHRVCPVLVVEIERKYQWQSS